MIWNRGSIQADHLALLGCDEYFSIGGSHAVPGGQFLKGDAGELLAGFLVHGKKDATLASLVCLVLGDQLGLDGLVAVQAV